MDNDSTGDISSFPKDDKHVNDAESEYRDGRCGRCDKLRGDEERK